MSILIKGLKMPRKDHVHVLVLRDDGRCIDEFGDVFPMTVVPPHGDLIDRGALEQDAQKRLLMCNKNGDQFQKPYEVMRAIALAPIIIPADEEGEG